MARIHDVVFDCRHPASVARFWAQVLEGYAVAPYDEAELERLRSNGIDDPEDDPTVLVEAGPGVTPRYFFQLVPEGKPDEPRTDPPSIGQRDQQAHGKGCHTGATQARVSDAADRFACKLGAQRRRVSMAEEALRPIEDFDLDVLFDQMRDPESVQMAAFTAKDPAGTAVDGVPASACVAPGFP
jgi:hypothetical protein